MASTQDSHLDEIFAAYLVGTITLAEAQWRASAPSLAATATVESIERILAFYAQMASDEADHSSKRVLAGLIERHASQLNSGDRSVWALRLYEAIWPVVEQHARPGDVGICLMHRGNALHGRGKFGEAVADYNRALGLLDQNTTRDDYACCLANRSIALGALGRHAEALAGYNRALVLLDQEATRLDHTRCLMNRSITLAAQGKYDDALAGYNRALPRLKELASLTEYGYCLMNRANSLQALNRHKEAIEDYDQILPLLDQEVTAGDHGRCRANRANAWLALGQHEKAILDYDLALPLLQKFGTWTDVANCLANRASARVAREQHHAGLADHHQAREALRKARRLARVDEVSVEFTTEFAGLFAGAVRSALACQDRDSAYAAVCDGKGTVLRDWHESARIDESEEVRTARRGLTDWMRLTAPTTQETQNLAAEEAQHEAALLAFTDDHPLRQDWLTHLRASVASSSPSEPPQELIQAPACAVFQAGRHDLTQAYLSVWSQVHHAYVADRPEADIPLADRAAIQAELPQDWALIDFWQVDENRFLAFVLFADDFEVVELPLPTEPRLRHAFHEKQTRLLESIQNPLVATPNTDALIDLYFYFFDPILPLLRAREAERKITGLYLVPHGFLHCLPLHAAQDQDRYLCDEFAIAYLPSASLLCQLSKVDTSGPAFVLANPEAGTAHSLSFAQWEGEKLRDLLGVPAERCFLGAAGKRATTSAWAGAGIIHFSCHGQSDDEFSPRSHLRLNDDLLLAHDVSHREAPIKKGALVILNGCQTSVPDARALNEGLGLMSAFLGRGAGLVFSTQWNVADPCAAEMVLEFTEQLHKHGKTPAEALKEAQNRIRNMTPQEIKKRNRAIRKRFPKASIERAKVDLHRAWLCRGLGEKTEAIEAAEAAAPALRAVGLEAEADAMLIDVRGAPLPESPHGRNSIDYTNPVFWAAFRLVGRVT